MKKEPKIEPKCLLCDKAHHHLILKRGKKTFKIIMLDSCLDRHEYIKKLPVQFRLLQGLPLSNGQKAAIYKMTNQD